MTETTATRDWFTLSGGSRLPLFLVCAVALAAPMLPGSWTGNEINYFDLAYREARPDLYGANHAIFDSSKGRFLSFWMIGSVIDAVGFEMARTIFALLSIALYGLALTGLAVVLGLGPAAMAIALAVYFTQQTLLGGEWLFATVEAKVFAYICVVAGIAAGASGQWIAAVVLTALGTAFHFLIGGFWGAALLALHALSTRDWRGTLRLLALFAALVSPLVALLAFERFGSEVDLTGLDRSLAEIYAVYRAPHHVAPFAGGTSPFFVAWFPGLVAHAGLAFALFSMHRDFGPQSRIALWVAGLNAYIPVVLAVAFLDRDTHVLAPFYMFRPSAMILFLSVLLLVRRVVLAIEPAVRRSLSLPAAVIVAVFLLPTFALDAALLVVATPIDLRLVASFEGAERGVLDWLRDNTTPQDVVIVQPSAGDEGAAFPAGLERLTPAAYYVNYKFVPTAPADMAEWYRRLKKRRAIFEGDCAQLAAVAPTLLIMRRATGATPLKSCTETVYRNDVYMILRPTGSRRDVDRRGMFGRRLTP